MELIEQEDTQDIFEECNGNEGEGIEESTKVFSSDLNMEHDKLLSDDPCKEESKDNFKDANNYPTKNNNHHIVPVGVAIVIMTIFLGMSNVPKCLVSCVENTPQATEDVKQAKENILNYLQKPEIIKNSQILERLLEYKDICKDLAVFTKDIEQNETDEEDDDDELEGDGEGGEDYDNDDDVNTKGVLKDIKVNKANNEEGSANVDFEGSSSSSSSSGSGSGGSAASGNGNNCGKSSRNKHKKSKYSIKSANTKNGFNKHNKSTKAKYQKPAKKELNLNKKNSTAEPIIYLFALVFIYLLLKAASDINQHYKSQNKNDKRLRRCSLQSYAQTHRPDRRASKELALKQKQQLKLQQHQQQQQQQQRLKSISRSSSQDQTNYSYNPQHQTIMEGSTQIIEQQNISTTTGSPIRPKISYSSNWQLLRQHTTTQSLDNSDILNTIRGNADLPSSLMTRRCSVPAALSYQRQKFTSTVSPLSIVNDHAIGSGNLSRRTSITSPLPLTMDPIDSLIPETKRRVRMINRH